MLVGLSEKEFYTKSFREEMEYIILNPYLISITVS